MRELETKILNKKAIIGVIGLGYVGLPLSISFCKKGYSVLGFEIDKKKIKKINSKINYISESSLTKSRKKIFATSKFSLIKNCDVVIITVPTPLKKNYIPDLSFVRNSMESILPFIRKNQLICLESTSYPGTTEDEIKKKIKGMIPGKDIFICYSPEREDPGNKYFKTIDVPKIVSGETSNCLKIAKLFYKIFFKKVVPVSSTKTAEFTKLLENIYRSVNIGLVNEMKIISKIMNVNIHEAIKAASTKPFGYRPFDPGPGMGGHCIPIDPYYMSWKANQLGYDSRFIRQSGNINTMMPKWIVSNIEKFFRSKKTKLKNLKILIIGVAYKKNINDDRESPAYAIMKILYKKGSKISYHDPLIKKISNSKLNNYQNLKSINLKKNTIKNFDATIIITDHDKINYKMLYQNSKIIFDCRNRFKIDPRKKNSKIIQL